MTDKEALAQTEQEPCGWQFYQDGKWHNGMETNNHRANTERAGIPVRDVYPAPQRTEQEPKQTIYLDDGPDWNDRFEAWWESHGQFCGAGGGSYEKTFAFRAYEAALSTPPQRKPLTDEQVISKALHLSGLGTSPDVLQFARAIEAAHGIKETT
jgi:hypothetical protein